MNNSDVNVVRFSCGNEFVRFEIARESEWGTMHNSRGERTTLHIDDLRGRMLHLCHQKELGEKDWTIAAA